MNEVSLDEAMGFTPPKKPAAAAAPEGGWRIDPAVQRQRDEDAVRLRREEMKPGGGSLLKTSTVVKGAKPAEESAPAEEVSLDEAMGWRKPPARKASYIFSGPQLTPQQMEENRRANPGFRRDVETPHALPERQSFLANLKVPWELWVRESLPAHLYQAYQRGHLDNVIKNFKLAADSKPPTAEELAVAERPAFGVRNRRGAVTAFTTQGPRAEAQPQTGPGIFQRLAEEFKKDPGKVIAELINGLIADPEFLPGAFSGAKTLGTAGARISASHAAAGRVVGAGLAGGGINAAVSAAQQLNEKGEIDPKELAAMTALGAGLAGPLAGILGRSTARSTRRPPPAEEPPQLGGPTAETPPSGGGPVPPQRPAGPQLERGRTFEGEYEVMPSGEPLDLPQLPPPPRAGLRPEEVPGHIRQIDESVTRYQQELRDLDTQIKEIEISSGRGPMDVSKTLKDLDFKKGLAEQRVKDMMAQRTLLGGEVPSWAKALGVGAGAYAAAQQIFGDDEAGIALAMAAAGVKAKGGMWHPKAVEAVSTPLFEKLLGRSPAHFQELLQEPAYRIPEVVAAAIPELKAKAAWTERASRNYLNRYMGTAEDPLSGYVEVPKLKAERTQVQAYVKQHEQRKPPTLERRTLATGELEPLEKSQARLTVKQREYEEAVERANEARQRLAQIDEALAGAKGNIAYDAASEVEIPFGEGTKRWGEVTDEIVKSTPLVDTPGWTGAVSLEQARKLIAEKPQEPVWDLDQHSHSLARERGGVPNSRALRAYLSHVGDYLRENVASTPLHQDDWYQNKAPQTFKEKYPPLPEGYSAVEAASWSLKIRESPEYKDYLAKNPLGDLGNYDLVRAVKETAKRDAEMAKAMEREALNASKDLPVYKEYPDGYRWVELKLPEKLTPEQMRQVRPATREEKINLEEGSDEPFGMARGPIAEAYVALDSNGKPLVNNYTREVVAAKTPEEAWLAGQLAREGNQMGHCVGGYCEPVAQGEARIFSLRDPKGRSHVTIETQPASQGFMDENRVMALLGPDGVQARREWSNAYKTEDISFIDWLARERPELGQRIQQALDFDDIQQIKGKQNRAPNAEYLPYVQDFVKGGKWGEVGDLENTGLKQKGQLNIDTGIPEFNAFLKERLPEFFTDEDYKGIWDQFAKENPDNPTVKRAREAQEAHERRRGERGSIDPRLLRGMALTGLGALAGVAVADDELLGAITGGAVGLALPIMARLSRTPLKGLGELVDKIGGNLSTRIGNVSPALRQRARNFEFQVLKQSHDYLHRVDDFLVGLNGLPKDLQGALSRAILTNDGQRVMQLLRTSAPELMEGWTGVRKVLDELRDRLVKEGRFAEGRADYYPRIVKDIEGLKNALGTQLRTKLQDELLAAEKRGASEVEKSKIINRFLQREVPGYGQPGFAKSRRVKEVTEQLEPFYATPTESLHSYIRSAVEDLERAKFFGRNLKNVEKNGQSYINLDESIGKLVLEEYRAGRITFAQVDELEKLLHARFDSREAGVGFIADLKNLANAGLLGNVVAAATQVGDIGTSVYMQGLRSTLKAVMRRATGRAEVDMRDFGLADHISEEFVSTRKSAEFLNKMFKYGGFSFVDRFGKDVALNAALDRFRRLSKTEKGRAKIAEKYGEGFKEEFPQLIDDLQKGQVTERVQALVFSELSDIQPITKLEMPQMYLENPNGRVMYMLKSFMLKQIDIVRRDAIQEIAKGNRAKGISNLTKYALVLGISGAGTDQVKDWLMGRTPEMEWQDIPLNVLKTFGWSEYALEKGKKEGWAKTFVQGVMPPYQMLEEIARGDPKAVRYIPLVGKLYYEHFMGGKEKHAERLERKRERELRRILEE